MSSNYAPIPIIDRMSVILDIMLNSPNGASASELFHRENIPKTTLYRLLTSMVQNEFLSYNSDTGMYTIGSKFTMTYVSMDEQTNRLKETSIPHLNQLVGQVQETVKLSVLSGWSAYVIASVESQQPIRIKIDTGATFPLHAGATGKIFMCDFSRATLQKYYAIHANRYTSTTIMSIEEMEAELDTVRTCGYALDNGEYLPEILAIAVPVKNQAGTTIAALSIPYPSLHRDRINIEQAAKLLNQTASAISLSCSPEGTKESPARVVDSLSLNGGQGNEL